VAHILEFHVGKQFSVGCGGDATGQSTHVGTLQDASVLYLAPSHPNKPPVTNTRRPVKTAVQSINFASLSPSGSGTGSGSATAAVADKASATMMAGAFTDAQVNDPNKSNISQRLRERLMATECWRRRGRPKGSKNKRKVISLPHPEAGR
jgi:hypothetical protein